MQAFVASGARLPLLRLSPQSVSARRLSWSTPPPIRSRQTLRASLDTSLLVSVLPPTLHLALTSPALSAAKLLAGPGINIFNFIMVVRIILTWYPQTDLAKAPWIYIAVPTEPLLKATRKVVPPIGGVDISPIVWFAIMSFVHEILVGPQGLLILLQQK